SADRMRYLEHDSNHQVIITGYDDPFATGTPNKWRVQNSWGKKRAGKDGVFIATDEWMQTNAFKVVIHRDALTPEVLAAIDTTPILLSAKDNPLLSEKPSRKRFK